jgi:hypothetical protein
MSLPPNAWLIVHQVVLEGATVAMKHKQEHYDQFCRTAEIGIHHLLMVRFVDNMDVSLLMVRFGDNMDVSTLLMVRFVDNMDVSLLMDRFGDNMDVSTLLVIDCYHVSI